MTPEDWLELFESMKGELRKREWRFEPHPQNPHEWLIRDKNGYCPLCALANEVFPPMVYRTAVKWALEQAALMPIDYEKGTQPIINAADDKSEFEIRARLIRILNVRN